MNQLLRMADIQIQQKYMIDLPLQHSHHHQHDNQDDEEQQEVKDVANLKEIPCHPHRPVASFDFSAIQEQIQRIRMKKEAAQEAARHVRKKIRKSPQEIYESDQIGEALEQSLEVVPIHVSVALKQRLKFIQDKVYIGNQSEGKGLFVERLKKQVLNNEALANELNLIMDQVQLSVENGIEVGEYQIHSVKHAVKHPPPQQQPSHRVKLKNMLIKNKLVDLREEFNRSDVINSESGIAMSMHSIKVSSSRVTDGVASGVTGNGGVISGVHGGVTDRVTGGVTGGISDVVNRQEGQIWGDEFHPLSQGTKKAVDFVKKLQKQQYDQRRQRRRKAKEMQSLQVKSAVEHKQFEQQIKKEKHEMLRRRYQDGISLKKAKRQKQQQNEREYSQFLKEYKCRKPLFRIKEEQFKHNVIEEQEQRRKVQLSEIHQAKKPMSHEELIEHQKKYLKWKQEKQEQSVAERQFKKKEEAGIPKKSFYRGRFHSLIKEEELQKEQELDPNLTRDELLKKQKQFAQEVRKKYAPLISEAKKKELEQLMRSLQKGRNEKALSEEQYRDLGNNYLRQLHKMIGQLRSKGLIKSEVQQEKKPKTKDYLREVRDRYNFSTLDYSSQVGTNSLWVESKAQKLEKDARIKQKVLKYKNNGQFDMQRYMRDLDAINEDYIGSAQAKISLINQLTGKQANKKSGTYKKNTYSKSNQQSQDNSDQ